MLKIDTTKIPSVDALRQRFSFIADLNLQTNICIAFQYIIFHINLLEDEDILPGPIRYSLYRGTILYTASIVEACLHYCIWELVKQKKIIATDIMPFEWINTESIKKHDVTETERVVGIVQRKSQNKLRTSTQFHELNKAARNADIFTSVDLEKAEWLREHRNQIHLVGNSDSKDVFPEREDIEKAFNHAKIIIEVLEKKCSHD